MKQATVNVFLGGLITDLNPLNAPPTVITKSKNIDFLTTEGNQFILQKRSGNDPELYEDVPVTLSSGFRPLAVRQLNNIAYIISYNDQSNEGEIGTFPSPKYSDFQYVSGSSYSPLTIGVTDTFYDEEDLKPDFFISLPVTNNVALDRWTTENVRLQVFNRSVLEDYISMTHSGEAAAIAPNPVYLSGSGASYFNVFIDTDENIFIEKLAIYGKSLTDTSVTGEALITNITISEPGTIAIRDFWSIAADTGNNIYGSGIWAFFEHEVGNPEALSDPIVKIIFAFSETYSYKRLKFFVKSQAYSWERPIDDYDIIETSNTAIPSIDETGNLVYNYSATCTVRLKGIKAIIVEEWKASQTPDTDYHILISGHVMDGVDSKVLQVDWKGDLNQGNTNPHTERWLTYNDRYGAGGLLQWQWGWV